MPTKCEQAHEDEYAAGAACGSPPELEELLLSTRYSDESGTLIGAKQPLGSRLFNIDVMKWDDHGCPPHAG